MSARDATRIERRDPSLPPLVPQAGWEVPDPVRSEVPEYTSYELDLGDGEKQPLVEGLQNVA